MSITGHEHLPYDHADQKESWCDRCGMNEWGDIPVDKKKASERVPFTVCVLAATHKPVQHRDKALPWCNTCGKTRHGGSPFSKKAVGIPNQEKTNMSEVSTPVFSSMEDHTLKSARERCLTEALKSFEGVLFKTDTEEIIDRAKQFENYILGKENDE